jgi:pantetheine-phosphate adenylyltransferase
MNGINSHGIGIYVGTFDPLTNGHCDVIRRASLLFGKLIVAIGENVQKTPFFPVPKRIELLTTVCENLNDNITIQSFQGLAVKFANTQKATVMVRGIRSEADFGYEMQMAMMNKNLDPGIETVFIPTSQELGHISSSLVKEVSVMGGDVSRMVPPVVFAALKEKSRRAFK